MCIYIYIYYIYIYRERERQLTMNQTVLAGRLERLHEQITTIEQTQTTVGSTPF